MAAFLRNSSAQLSFITNAFRQLQLQNTRASVVARHPSQRHFITQTRPDLLRQATRANVTTSQRARDRSSPKPTSDTGTFSLISRLPLPAQAVGEKLKPRKFPMPHRRRRWTYEEDILLFRLIKEDWATFDIYTKHFPYRSHAAISRRSGVAFKAARVQDRQAREGVREGEVDIGKSVAGEEGTVPLGKVFTGFYTSIRAERSENISDDADLHYESRRGKTRRGKWTPEEEELLEKLVSKYRHLPEPAIWNSISGSSVDDSPPLLRTGVSCNRRWNRLYPPPSYRTGRWTEEEDLRLQEAIWEQLEGKYQVAVDVLVGKPATTELNLSQWPPQLQQLSSQAGLPILKIASRRLGLLNWLLIGQKVGTRSDGDCRGHFYHSYHNSNRGPWSEEEMRRLEEGREMFGGNYWRIAEHVGTRGPRQVTIQFSLQERKEKRRKRAVEDSKETLPGKEE